MLGRHGDKFTIRILKKKLKLEASGKILIKAFEEKTQ